MARTSLFRSHLLHSAQSSIESPHAPASPTACRIRQAGSEGELQPSASPQRPARRGGCARTAEGDSELHKALRLKKNTYASMGIIHFG